MHAHLIVRGEGAEERILAGRGRGGEFDLAGLARTQQVDMGEDLILEGGGNVAGVLGRGSRPSAKNPAASLPAFSSTQLWAMTSFGAVPMLCRTTFRSSPGLRLNLAVTLYFMLSAAVISTIVRRDLAGAAGAVAAPRRPD